MPARAEAREVKSTGNISRAAGVEEHRDRHPASATRGREEQVHAVLDADHVDDKEAGERGQEEQGGGREPEAIKGAGSDGRSDDRERSPEDGDRGAAQGKGNG